MLTSAQIKPRVGLEVDDDTYDDKFALAIPLVTRWFEQYCGRGFVRRTVASEVVTNWDGAGRIYLYNRPIVSVTSLTADGIAVDVASLRINKEAGYIEMSDGSLTLALATDIVVAYVGGYEDTAVPADLAQAFAEACAAYAGVTFTATIGNMGGTSSSAIKAIGLGGGALNVQFDSQAGGLSGSYHVGAAPPEVQQYVSVLNYYRWIAL